MISVIVPVYNAEEYLESCVESVLTQSYGNFELILIDDGSTDGSGELCDRLAHSDGRIVVIHRKNGGVSRARNTGLDAAKGDVIAFLDCDDYVLPGMYENMTDKMERSKARIAVCSVMDELEDGSVRKYDSGETVLITGRDALRYLVTGMGDSAGHKETIWFSVWNKFYDAKLFNPPRLPAGSSAPGIRFDPETDSAEDVPVNLAAFSRTDHILYFEKPYYFWRHRIGSQTDMKAPAALRGGTRTSRYIFDYAKTLPEKDRPAAVTAAVRHFYWYYTACIYALSKARSFERKAAAAQKTNSGADMSGSGTDAYLRLRSDMLNTLKGIAAERDYKLYTAGRFKATVRFMLGAPALFAFVWLVYRRLKRL